MPRLANAESYPGPVTQITVTCPGEDVVLIISQIHGDAIDRHDGVPAVGERQLIGIERRPVRRDLGFTAYCALIRETACARGRQIGIGSILVTKPRRR